MLRGEHQCTGPGRAPIELRRARPPQRAAKRGGAGREQRRIGLHQLRAGIRRPAVEREAVESGDERVRPPPALRQPRRHARRVLNDRACVRGRHPAGRCRNSNERVRQHRTGCVADLLRGDAQRARHDAPLADHTTRCAEREVSCERVGHELARAAEREIERERPVAATRAQRDPVLLSEYRAAGEVRRRHAEPPMHVRARRSALRDVVARHDVRDAAQRVRAVQGAALRPTNHLDVIDRLRRDACHQQRVGDLDAVDVDLRRTRTERAGPADAAPPRGQPRRRPPQPDARHPAVQRLRQVAGRLVRDLAAVDDLHGDGRPRLRRAGRPRLDAHRLERDHWRRLGPRRA